MLAAKETKAREESDERREQAEEQALRVSFENFYAKAKDDPRIGLLGAIHLLPQAARLKDRTLADSLEMHMAGWRAQCNLPIMVFGHQGEVGAVAFSPDGKSVLTGG